MKWIFSLILLSAALSSCTTKPYMVGSVNEQWYKRWRKPGAGWDDGKDKRQYDYSWQERLRNTAHIPVIYRENRPHTEPAPAPIAQPYTSGKDVTYSK